MSTQVSTGTQLSTVGVDEVLGEVGNAKTPRRGSIDARRPSPKRIVTRVNTALNEALQSPELAKLLNSRGADAVGGTPEAFAKVVRADFAKWAKVVKESGARVD